MHDVANSPLYFPPVRSTSVGWCDELFCPDGSRLVLWKAELCPTADLWCHVNKHEKHFSIVHENSNP